MRKIKPNDFIMNKKSMDICSEVLEISSLNDDSVTIKVRFWNLGYSGDPWILTGEFDSFDIKFTDVTDWVVLSDEQISTPRTKSGIPGEAV